MEGTGYGYNRRSVLAIMYVLLFMIAFVSGLQNPFGVIVKEQFGASNALSQIGNFASFIAYALMGYPAGKILHRYGYRVTSLVAVSIGFIGVLVQLFAGIAASLAMLITGAFIAGFSMCLLNTLTNSMLNHIGGGGKKGNQLLQFGGTFYTIGGMAVPYFVGMLVAQRHVLIAAAPAFIFALAVFLLAAVAIGLSRFPEPDLEARRANVAEQKPGSKYSCLSFRHFLLGAVAIFLYMGVEVGIANTTNLYLTNDLEMATGAAGAIISIYWLFMILGRLMGGFAGSRISSRTMLASVSGLSMVFIVLAMVSPSDIGLPLGIAGIGIIPLNVLFLVLCGMCVAVMWGNIFNLAVEGLGKFSSEASGIFMIMVCGGGVMPALQGVISDHFGYMASFSLILVSLAYLIYYAFFGSRNVNKDIPVD